MRQGGCKSAAPLRSFQRLAAEKGTVSYLESPFEALRKQFETPVTSWPMEGAGLLGNRLRQRCLRLFQERRPHLSVAATAFKLGKMKKYRLEPQTSRRSHEYPPF